MTGAADAVAFGFATDAETEAALREGLEDLRDAQVWRGALRSATLALARAGDPAPKLIFVDLDETPYPAGALHELAAVCEVGATVVALGSDYTARFAREALLAGVSDYLVKPVLPEEIASAAAAALAPADDTGGRAAAFAGVGGSGATTLAAAAALLAAERGRYVSVLDLNRLFPALPFVLDVEPAPGLDQLLDTAGGAEPDADLIDGVRAERSDRIAVYAYRWGAEIPPPPRPSAVRRLVAQLRRRSHLVLVDGIGDPEARLTAAAGFDTRVLAVEPTAEGARRGARALSLLDGAPAIFALNRTRPIARRAARRALEAAGLKAAPDVAVPFDSAIPPLADRGWPGGRLPASLRKPVGALLDRLAAPAGAAAA